MCFVCVISAISVIWMIENTWWKENEWYYTVIDNGKKCIKIKIIKKMHVKWK